MGAVVTVELPEDSPLLAHPWIVTFGPLTEDDEDESIKWEPVVCGPYERAHALSLAETVVADEELMAVVEPVNPYATVEEIRAEIDMAIQAGEELDEEAGDVDVSLDDLAEEDVPEVAPSTPPSPEEVRAGFARIASRLAAGV